jgi:hypothetical protein
MKRQRSQATSKRDQELLDLINPIKTDHPLWGYRRRIWGHVLIFKSSTNLFWF